jgi:GH15 family glucan-1,4-alpha-glucosidase
MADPRPIEDYALVGDLRTGAMISRDGRVDWLCLPRFDSPALFAALVGDEEAGQWRLAPEDAAAEPSRAYLPGTLVLRTHWRTDSGDAEVIEFMPVKDGQANLVRRVRGLRGTVRFREVLRIRFDYGAAVPWVRQVASATGWLFTATAGPDAVFVRGPRMTAAGLRHEVSFDVTTGDEVDLVMTWYPSYGAAPDQIDVDRELARTIAWWRDWAERSSAHTEYRDEVGRSLLTLRALTHDETGGIVAAPTTSLPEELGGERNWDYRYVWLRDAALTIGVLLTHGYREEADQWRDWLLRAIAGDPADIQIVYGVGGERRLSEYTLPGLSGYGGARPVRVGNAAYQQRQWDVYGEVMIALHGARTAGLEETSASWPLQRALLGYLAEHWRTPDRGIWEIRGKGRRFTHSQAMVWAAFDRAVRGVTEYGLPGDADHWTQIRDRVRAAILRRGFDAERNTFVQYFGSTEVDAALLQLPQIGFIEATDPRMLGTVAAIESELMRDGLVLRYRSETGVDGVAGREHPFLACSFWLVEQYASSGRIDDATRLMDRLVSLANDVGLHSEEYDPARRRQMGNMPQALTHLALVRAADALAAARAGAQPHVRGKTEGAQAHRAETRTGIRTAAIDDRGSESS